MTKLESYMVDGNFASTEFYAEVEGHPEQGPLKLALEELAFYSEKVRILGTFPQHPFRRGG
jgi:prephenate dehydratase